MKLLIAGSRKIGSGVLCQKMFDAIWPLTILVRKEVVDMVVSGGCKGSPDVFGEEWAAQHKIPCQVFPADWDKHGKAAGLIRNRQMAEFCGSDGMLIAIWDGESHGTANMVKEALAIGMDVFGVSNPTREINGEIRLRVNVKAKLKS